jgi:hypothetical protein
MGRERKEQWLTHTQSLTAAGLGQASNSRTLGCEAGVFWINSCITINFDYIIPWGLEVFRK